MKTIPDSQSQARPLLLARLGYEVETMPTNIEEEAICSDDFERLPQLGQTLGEHVW